MTTTVFIKGFQHKLMIPTDACIKSANINWQEIIQNKCKQCHKKQILLTIRTRIVSVWQTHILIQDKALASTGGVGGGGWGVGGVGVGDIESESNQAGKEVGVAGMSGSNQRTGGGGDNSNQGVECVATTRELGGGGVTLTREWGVVK